MTLGIISFATGLFAILTIGRLYYFLGYVLMFVMPILIITYGIIGVIKDKGVAMAIVGLNLGVAYFLMMVLRYFMNFMYYPPYYP